MPVTARPIRPATTFTIGLQTKSITLTLARNQILIPALVPFPHPPLYREDALLGDVRDLLYPGILLNPASTPQFMEGDLSR